MDKCECGCATTVYGPLVRLDPETKIWLTAGRLMIFGFFGLPGSTLVGMPIFITTHEFQVLYTTREEIIEILKNDSNFGLSGDDSLIYTGFGDPFNTGNDYLDQMQDRLDKFLNSFPNIEDLCACGDDCSMEAPPTEFPMPLWMNGVVDDQLKYIESVLGPHPLPTPPAPPDLPASKASPIIIDLDGDGVETTAKDSGSNFDHDGNRFAEKSGWAGADDALLVFDRDGNGQIDGGNELFGNNYTLANGKKAANGFEALKEFDSNGDGVVDKNDERWSELQLWQDKNGDGKVDDGELLTLEEAGVAGLNTGYTNQSKTDENGNKHLQTGAFIREDGTTGQMTDVWFQTDLADTVYLDEIAINCPSILGLPNLRGYGNIPSLHQAMALDETGALKALVQQFVNADPLEAKSLIWDIIFTWTGVADIVPNSYPWYNGDARKLYALERLTGTIFGNGAPFFGGNDHNRLAVFFEGWENRVASYFLLSTHYNGFYSDAVKTYQAYIDTGISTGMDAWFASLRSIYENSDGKARYMLLDFLHQLGVYDAKGRECIAYIKTAFIDLASEDAFIKDVCLSIYVSLVGTEANNTLIASKGALDVEGFG